MILDFHLGESSISQTIPSARTLPGTTNEGQTLSFHPKNRDSVLKEHHQKMESICPVAPSCQYRCCKTPNTYTQEEPVQQVFITTNQYTSPLLQNSDRSHHDFLHLCQCHGNLYLDMSHNTNTTAELRATPL
jgi:hypothetical protein